MPSDPQIPESGDGFHPGGTPGGRWGCALAGAVVACCLPLIGIMAMATRGMGDWLLHGWLPVALVAAVVGFAIRALVNLAWRRRRGADAGVPLWTVAVSLAAAAAAVVLFYDWYLRPY